MTIDMCYASTAKDYRAEMAGSPDAGSLPKPTNEALQEWGKSAQDFRDLKTQIEQGLREAEAAHKGSAADAANASIQAILPSAENAATACDQIKSGLEQQINNQSKAFNSLPAKGDYLPNGREVQLDIPQKEWYADVPIIGGLSDYEERQEDFRTTNDQAVQVMQAYQQQTDTVLGGLPNFQQDKPAPPPNQPPPGSGMPSASDAMAGSGYSSGPSMSGGVSAPAGSSSSWTGGTGGGGVAAPPSGGYTPPAGSGSSWTPSNPNSPGGPYVPGGPNAPRVPGGPGPVGGPMIPGGPGGPGGGGGGAGAGRGGGTAGAGGVRGGVGAGAGSGSQLGAGGRAGVGGMGGMSGAGAGAGASGSSAGGARGGGMMGGAGAGAARGAGEDEEEHERPSWLVEADDVFTNDMQKVAPPVLGE